MPTLTPREREALGAFVLGWAHHWPTSFRATFAADADATLAAAERATSDPNRRIKLRRIAIEHLSTVL